VALARPHVNTLHTFAGGVAGAPDLIAARQVAEALNTTHHEVVVTLEDMLAALPQVIYHLESFDAPLVRSSVMNYLVAQRAAEHVGSIFSGEGADELFAGYAYLQEMRQDRLAPELLDITRQLHNTALQRVDRSAAAHGLVAHIPFLDLDVVQYAMRIPAELKLWRDEHAVEKWILRRSLEGTLPEAILWRQKAKFWHGSGLEDMLSDHAENVISDGEMGQAPPEGHVLRSKEEMMYYRIFRQQFGDLDDLSWVGRTGMIAP
jgi:asparagine synthase (glutamine-hydrolysing)